MRTCIVVTLFCAAVLMTMIASNNANSQYTGGYQQPVAGTAIVPYYSAVYNPGAGQAAEDAKAIIAELKALNSRLASIDQRLANLESKAGLAPITVPAAVKLDPFVVASKKCSSCHTPSASDAKGGGFILFATDEVQAFKPLSTREKAKIKEAVQSGTMPPAGKGKLEPHEKAAFTW